MMAIFIVIKVQESPKPYTNADYVATPNFLTDSGAKKKE
jgi:hypothetical protein